MKTKRKHRHGLHSNGVAELAVVPPAPLLKLDFGCGPNPREGFEGVDVLPFDGKVQHVTDLRQPWPWADASVGEAHSSHFLEHLTAVERVHFVNELYRVLVPGGKCTLIVPHWCSNRAYGDPTHQWPPVSEMWFYYLNREWRAQNAPHTDRQHWPGGFACDFEATWGYAMHQQIAVKHQEAQQFALQFYKEAAQDMIATLTKR
jgi:SAM-dependent methyltransferase